MKDKEKENIKTKESEKVRVINLKGQFLHNFIFMIWKKKTTQFSQKRKSKDQF